MRIGDGSGSKIGSDNLQCAAPVAVAAGAGSGVTRVFATLQDAQERETILKARLSPTYSVLRWRRSSVHERKDARSRGPCWAELVVRCALSSAARPR